MLWRRAESQTRGEEREPLQTRQRVNVIRSGRMRDRGAGVGCSQQASTAVMPPLAYCASAGEPQFLSPFSGLFQPSPPIGRLCPSSPRYVTPCLLLGSGHVAGRAELKTTRRDTARHSKAKRTASSLPARPPGPHYAARRCTETWPSRTRCKVSPTGNPRRSFRDLQFSPTRSCPLP